MAKKIKDIYVSERQKFARKLDRSKNTDITVNGRIGKIHSITKEVGNDEKSYYRVRILLDGLYVSGKADKKQDAIIEALKHLELQGNIIKEYMK
jgi:hypothetical protein